MGAKVRSRKSIPIYVMGATEFILQGFWHSLRCEVRLLQRMAMAGFTVPRTVTVSAETSWLMLVL